MSDSEDDANDNGLSEVALAIRRYIGAHPNAADTLDGILHWWLTRQRYADSAHEVRLALNELEGRGLISHIRLADGKIVYQREAQCSKKNDAPS